MSDRPLQAGDMVIIKRNHCTNIHVGRISVVHQVLPSREGKAQCTTCAKYYATPDLVVLDFTNHPYVEGPCGFPSAYLQRLDPKDLGDEKPDVYVERLRSPKPVPEERPVKVVQDALQQLITILKGARRA